MDVEREVVLVLLDILWFLESFLVVITGRAGVYAMDRMKCSDDDYVNFFFGLLIGWGVGGLLVYIYFELILGLRSAPPSIIPGVFGAIAGSIAIELIIRFRGKGSSEGSR
ncbi:MAG: hypothetical protein ABFD46_00760 [Armatimonadota bacterium]